jgi:hypothetical protein
MRILNLLLFFYLFIYIFFWLFLVFSTKIENLAKNNQTSFKVYVEERLSDAVANIFNHFLLCHQNNYCLDYSKGATHQFM